MGDWASEPDWSTHVVDQAPIRQSPVITGGMGTGGRQATYSLNPRTRQEAYAGCLSQLSPFREIRITSGRTGVST
jgi:hypothetical protein